MKKAIFLFVTILVLTSIFTSSVSGLTQFMGEQPACDFAKLIHDYDIITMDPRDIITALFDIKKSDIKVIEEPFNVDNIMYCEWLQLMSGKTAEEAVQYHNDIYEEYGGYNSVTIYYYDFTGNHETAYDADIKLFTTSTSDAYGYNSRSCVYINSEALGNIEPGMADFLKKIDTPKKLFEVCDVSIPTEYYDINSYHKDVHHSAFNELRGDYFWILNGSVEHVQYNYIKNRAWFGSIADSGANDFTYLINPYCAKIVRSFNTLFSDFVSDPIYGYKLNEDSDHYELTVNYTAPNGVKEGDYLAYTLDNISIEVDIIEMNVNETAPATGTPTVPLAIASAVSLFVVIYKKRKIF